MNSLAKVPHDPSINWKDWSKKTEVHVWEAIFLSMGINPKNIKGDFEKIEDDKVMASRLKLLMEDAGDKNLFATYTPDNDNQKLDRVSFGEFAAWCFLKKVRAPSRLLAIGESVRFNRAEKRRREEGRYTLEEASEHMAASNETDAKSMVKKLMNAVKNGSLTTYEFDSKAKYLFEVGKSTSAALGDLEAYYSDLNEWLKLNEPRMDFRFPIKSPHIAQPTHPKAVVVKSAEKDDTWKLKACNRAAEIIERQRVDNLYPSQNAIADEIAKDFRRDMVVGAEGKPLSGAYIKRHALKGISSAHVKQISTSIGQSK